MRPENDQEQDDDLRGETAEPAPDSALIASWTPASIDRRQATLYLRFPKRGRRRTDPSLS